MADVPAYPVYVSPDGSKKQVAATPAREVQLTHAGWRKVTQPRRRSDARQSRRDARQETPEEQSAPASGA